MTSLRLSELVAIDVHAHAEVSERGAASLSPELEAASNAYFKVEGAGRPTVPEIAAYYRERRMACVVFPVDAEAATGRAPVPNEEVAEAAAANPDVLIPFASIDPAKGRAGAAQARRLADRHGVRGFKFHPNVQQFYQRPLRLPAVRGDRGARAAGGLPHRADRHRRRGRSFAVAVATGIGAADAFAHLPAGRRPHLSVAGVDALLAFYEHAGDEQVRAIRYDIAASAGRPPAPKL